MTSPTADGRTHVLADGHEMPMLGLGVWQVPDGPDCVNAVRWALDLGYRHIDTAQAYGNEQSVGRVARERSAPRGGVPHYQVQSGPAKTQPPKPSGASRRLGVDEVDLYLVHWPQGGPTRAWPGMERARQLGYARSVGVSNFSVAELEQVMAVATVPPVVNQVQFSAFEYRRALLDACWRRGVVLEAYSPLGTGRNLADETVIRIAARARAGPRPGAAALVRATRCPGHPEVDAPRAHRGERPDLRLRPVGRRHGRTRRAR